MQTPLVCLSVCVNQGDAKQSGQRYFSRALSHPVQRCDPIPGVPVSSGSLLTGRLDVAGRGQS